MARRNYPTGSPSTRRGFAPRGRARSQDAPATNLAPATAQRKRRLLRLPLTSGGTELPDLPIRLEYLAPIEAAALFAALALPTAWLWWALSTGLDPLKRWVILVLRIDLLLFLVLVLAGLRWESSARDLTVVAAVDRSRSALLSAEASRVDAFLAEAAAARPDDDRLGIVRFGVDAAVVQVPATNAPTTAVAADFAADGTDAASAIRTATAIMPPDTMRRILLAWDGRATAGDLEAALDAAVAQDVRVDVLPLSYDVRREVRVARLIAPQVQREGQAFGLDVILENRGDAAVRATLTVTDNDRPIDLDPETSGIQGRRPVTLLPGRIVERVPVPAGGAAVHRFAAWIEPETGSDTLLANNRREAVTVVRGQGRVLIVEGPGVGQGADRLADSLASAEVVVERTSAEAFPRRTERLAPYDAAVLLNVPLGIGGLDRRQDELVARWVHDLGGGLVKVGGPDAFGAGGWTGSATEGVLPVTCRVDGKKVMPAGAMVFVLDKSSSMSGSLGGSMTKQQAAAEAAVLALETLLPRDLVGVVAFDAEPQWLAPLAENRDPASVSTLLREAGATGGTSIYPALWQAATALAELPADRYGARHVLLLTDGRSQGDGDFGLLMDDLRGRGITLSTVGVGDDVDRQLLADLASRGGGVFHEVRDPRTLPQLFIKEARTLRRNLIREVPFTPQRTAIGPMPRGVDLPAGPLPTLDGLIVTGRRHDRRVTTALVNDRGDPLLAFGQAGLGQVVAFTSDAGSRWAAEWADAPVYNQVWRQLVLGVMRQRAGDLDARIEQVSAGRARLVVEAIRPDGGGEPALAVTARVLTPDGEAADRPLELVRAGPGLYAAEFETPQSGVYVAAARAVGASGEGGWTTSAHVVDEIAEVAELRSDPAAIRRVASRTGGRVLDFTQAPALFDRADLIQRRSHVPLRDALLVLCLAAFLADVAARRLRWDRASVATAAASPARWVQGHTSTTAPPPNAAAGQTSRHHPPQRPPPSAATQEAPESLHASSPRRDRMSQLAEAKRQARASTDARS